MKSIVWVALFLPLTVLAQMAVPPLAPPAKNPPPEAFAEVGYVNELWTLSNQLSNGYATTNYVGNGGYLGGGFRSVAGAKRHIGYGLSVDYLHYTMSKLLSVNERAATGYSFLKAAPMAYFAFASRSAYNFQVCGVLGIMTALKANEHTYVQYGAKACMGYKAYEVSFAANFAQRPSGPATDVQGKWREQMLTLGIACYPGRIALVKQYGKIKNKPVKGKMPPAGH